MIKYTWLFIDYFYHAVMRNPKTYFSAEDAFKIALLKGNIPVLIVDILSRIPVNIVDRFIVIAGGFFIAQRLKLATISH